jgi:hypothetical protein
MQPRRCMDDRSKMEAVQLGQLVLPVARRVHKRVPLPVEGERPKLYVIVTPPEVRARWQRWVAIRQSILLTFVITFVLIAAMAAL